MDKQRITGDCDGAVMMKIGQNKTVTPNITLHLPLTQQQNSGAFNPQDFQNTDWYNVKQTFLFSRLFQEVSESSRRFQNSIADI